MVQLCFHSDGFAVRFCILPECAGLDLGIMDLKNSRTASLLHRSKIRDAAKPSHIYMR